MRVFVSAAGAVSALAAYAYINVLRFLPADYRAVTVHAAAISGAGLFKCQPVCVRHFLNAGSTRIEFVWRTEMIVADPPAIFRCMAIVLPEAAGAGAESLVLGEYGANDCVQYDWNLSRNTDSHLPNRHFSILINRIQRMLSKYGIYAELHRLVHGNNKHGHQLYCRAYMVTRAGLLRIFLPCFVASILIRQIFFLLVCSILSFSIPAWVAVELGHHVLFLLQELIAIFANLL